MTTTAVHPVDEKLPTGRLAVLGLQHVLVMYAGAVAVPLIVGRALKLTPEQVALLISADLFACGLATVVQSFGATRWFGIKLPVMMGVTFAAVSPMLAFAAAKPGTDGARAIFGAIIGARVGGAVVVHGGEDHRVRLGNLCGAGLFEPPAELDDRVGIGVGFGEPGAGQAAAVSNGSHKSQIG